MRIFCEKCNKDISLKVDAIYENYTPGRIECDKCQKFQSRYVSEADILLYYGVSEVVYVIISLITNAILTATKLSLWMIPVLVGIVIAYFVLQKQVSRILYTKAYFKEAWKNYDFKEDANSINKSMKWQFMLFFAIAITFMIDDTAKFFFGILLLLSVVLTFVKFYLALKREKEIVSKDIKKIKED